MLTTSEVPGQEQRQSRRYSVNFHCEIKPAKQPGKRVSAHTQDVSRGGLYLSVPTKWKVGTRIEFVLHLPLKATAGRPVAVRCQGKVARLAEQADGQFGVGATIEEFEFIHPDAAENHSGRLKTALVRSAKALRRPGTSLATLFGLRN